MKAAEEVTRLFEYAVAHPDGFTRPDIYQDLGWNRSHFNKILKLARWWLGDTDTVNLVCDPQGDSAPWLYRLVGTGALAAPWQENRTGDMITRLVTLRSMSKSLARAYDGRTTDGKIARYADKVLGRLIEDLEEMRVSR